LRWHPNALAELDRLDARTQQSIRRWRDRAIVLDQPEQLGKALRGPWRGYWSFQVGGCRLLGRIKRSGNGTILYIDGVMNRRTAYSQRTFERFDLRRLQAGG
jgi:mRNA-degrading endonuclease RelE of RelBE toxin-antitoxin system